MQSPVDCPWSKRCESVFDPDLPTPERRRCEQHLETCTTCQISLERTEECWDSLRQIGRQVGDLASLAADTSLSRFLQRLHDAGSSLPDNSVELADLGFLRPSNRTDFLGTLDEYEVQEVIGHGSMGLVLKGFEPALNRVVALKVMAPTLAGNATARQRFSREAHAAAAVSHENIVAVHAVRESAVLPYLVMQYIPGESLQNRLDRDGPMGVEEIVLIALQTARGLAAAHAQGLIHRDIKPANLLLMGSPEALNGTDETNGTDESNRSYPSHLSHKVVVKITDFGLARMVDDVALTQSGVVAGTPEYMAPEQARGEKVDHRADLFSLACVLYACCTGRPPFRGSSAVAVLRKVCDEGPLPVRSLNAAVPVWLEALVLRLLEKDPARRIHTAAEVSMLLEGYLVHLRQPATVPAPPMPKVLPEDSPAREKPTTRSLFGIRGGAWFWLGALMLVVGLPLSLLLLARANAQSGKLRDEQVYDFRGRPIPEAMSPFSPDADRYMKVEAEGLRIALPRDRESFYPSGFSLPMTLEGDFEITLAFEILQVDTPAKEPRSYGLGVLMSLNETARIGCLRRAGDIQVISWDRWDRTVDPQKFLFGRSLCTSPKGRLRLKRTKSSLEFLWSPESAGEQFEQTYQFEFGTDDITQLRLELATNLGGERRGTLDVRLIELRIRPSNSSADNVFAASEQSESLSRGWLSAGFVLGLAITFIGVSGWLFVRRRRADSTTRRVGAAENSSPSESLASSVSVRCPGCGQTLKGKTELAGKKVKCPKCGVAVLVPSISSGG